MTEPVIAYIPPIGGSEFLRDRDNYKDIAMFLNMPQDWFNPSSLDGAHIHYDNNIIDTFNEDRNVMEQILMEMLTRFRAFDWGHMEESLFKQNDLLWLDIIKQWTNKPKVPNKHILTCFYIFNPDADRSSSHFMATLEEKKIFKLDARIQPNPILK